MEIEPFDTWQLVVESEVKGGINLFHVLTKEEPNRRCRTMFIRKRNIKFVILL